MSMRARALATMRRHAATTYKQSCTIDASGTLSAATPYAAPAPTGTAYACRYTDTQTELQDKDGVAILADCTLYLPYTATVPDVCTITRDDGKAFRLLKTQPLRDPEGSIYEYKLLLGAS